MLAGLEPELPDGAIVWLSSSMPVRDVEAYFPQSPKRLRFLANRGANGIDGVVSSAAGAALAAGAPAWLLTGELALLHDIGGLLAARRAGADLQVVCLNNGGGGIFDFLPVAEHADAGALRGAHRHPGRASTWPRWRPRSGRCAPTAHERATCTASSSSAWRAALSTRAYAGAVALRPFGRVHDRRLAAAQARVLLVLEELLGRHEAGRRGVAAGAGRVALLAAARVAVEALDHAERDRARRRRSGRCRRWRAPTAAAWLRCCSERLSMIAIWGR